MVKLTLPKHLDGNSLKVFLAGAISVLIIKFIITDLESWVLNLFGAFGLESKIFIAVILGIIVYYLLK